MPTNLLDTNCFGTIFQRDVNFAEVYVSLSVVGWIVTGIAQFYRGTKIPERFSPAEGILQNITYYNSTTVAQLSMVHRFLL